MTYPVAIKVLELSSHNRGNLSTLKPSRLIRSFLKGIDDMKRIPAYFHVDVVLGLATLHPSPQLFDEIFHAALIETLMFLTRAHPEVRKRIHGVLKWKVV